MLDQAIENTRPPKGRYSVEEREQGLIAVAICGGNTHRASRELADRGLEIPRTTLASWQTNHADRYERIRSEVVPKVHARMARESEDLARRYAEEEHKLMDELAAKRGEMKGSELAGAI